MKLLLIPTFWMLYSLIFSDPSYTTQEASYLERGLQQKQAGNYAAALEIWEEARTVLQNPSLAISLEHIQLVTEQNLDEAYQVSSAMYFWGLSALEIDPMVLQQEMDMLEPIVDTKEYKTWRDTFEEQPAAVLPLIQSFWLSQDPTPASSYNERLMEHWERIAHARKHFTKADNTIYGTDDRGIGWVRFGEPDLLKEGILTLYHSDIYNIMYRRTRSPNWSQRLANEATNRGKLERVYEVWIYDSHDIDPLYNNILIYGDTAVKGFARANSINDFIPLNAYSISERVSGPITPAILMQIELLEQLVGLDPQFTLAYERLTNEFFREGPSAVLYKRQAFVHKVDQETIAHEVRRSAPEEVSTYEDAFPSIPIEIYTYRFLDDANNPFSIVYLESQPQGSFIIDSARNKDIMEDDNSNISLLSYYSFTHGLQIRGANQRLLASQELRPDIDIDVDISLQSPPSISIFQVPYVSAETWEVYYAQLKNNHPHTKPEIDSPFPNELRSIGTKKRLQQEPLDTNPATLQISDLIIGYDLKDDDGSVLIPFKASHNTEIPEGENLAFHYELYHLKQDPAGIARFEVDIEVQRRQRGLNRLKKDEVAYTLRLNQQSDRSFFRENLEVETENLEPGTYVLEMNITDTTNGQQIDKKIEFTIIGK